MKKINAAFVGGGLCSVIGLGQYSLLEEKQLCHCISFSGASIGSVIAICLAAFHTTAPSLILQILSLLELLDTTFIGFLHSYFRE